ncbi:hypothetical protein TNCV_3967831 [Trichonephila clavipes]|nr:hypothetical protein TNCV_3967831 [Trichonephila clavipes]
MPRDYRNCSGSSPDTISISDVRVFRTPGEGELGNASRVSITVTYEASDGWQSLPFHSLDAKKRGMFLNKM